MTSLIVACDKNGVIANNGDIPWDLIKEDMALFKENTLKNIVIMGRKTYETLPVPNGYNVALLKDRINIVYTRKNDYDSRYFLESKGDYQEGLVFVHDDIELLETLCSVHSDQEIFIIGGGLIYNKFLYDNTNLFVDNIYLSVVDGDYNGDVYIELPFNFSEYKRVGEEIGRWRLSFKKKFDKFNFFLFQR